MAANLSYWEKKHFFNYDVLIAGGGIVGLNAAITLKEKQPALSVALMERGLIPTGASTKNAGFACFGSISELIEQEKTAGTDGLHALIGKRWRGLQKLRNLLGDKNIGFKNHGGYELFKPEEAALANQCVAKLGHFNSLIADIVKERETYRPASAKIGAFGFKKVDVLIENVLEAQLDPGQMMKALMVRALSLGIFIFNNCTVDAFEPEGNHQKIITTNGIFTCKRLLCCTNAFTATLLPELDIVPGRGQVIVTSPIKDLKFEGIFHYQKGYYYFRNIDGRVLLGGGRNLDFKAEETTAFGQTPLVQQALTALLSEVVLPGSSFTVDHSWSGIMAFGQKLEPVIKEARPNVFCAVRCNGMGIAIGSQTGEDAGKLVLSTL